MYALKKYFLIFCVFYSCTSYAEGHINYKLESIVEGLDHPWSMAFISNDEILVTELSGQLRLVKNGKLLSNPIKGVPKVLFAGQGGLSEVLLHPNFKENGFIYLSFSETDSEQPKLNTLRVIRGMLVNDSLIDIITIFKASPSRETAAHYGARLLFLMDGTLLITSGDAFNHREQAQKLDNHYGKILRLNDDGSIPEDNPFLSLSDALPEIWSYGHRNLQGIVKSPDGKIIFEHEHGPKGGDELNIIEQGKNYGWPAITYGLDYSGAIISPFKKKSGMEQPIKYWVPSIAPSGMTFYSGSLFPEWKNSLFISALVPGDVRRLTLDGDKVLSEEVLFDTEGRIRNIVSAPDGTLVIATDGPNGKLLRVVPNN